MGDSIVHSATVASNEKEMVKKEERKTKKEEPVTGKAGRAPGESAKKTFTYEEAIKATRLYFGGDDLAAKVWASKYALKDSFGNLYEKTPDDMHRRLASEIHRIEQKYSNPVPLETIYEAFRDFRYIIPQGGPMTGIGNDFQIASLSNCFVIGNKGDSDSYGGIMKIDQEQVQLMKRRGGVGHDLSHIRPKGSPVLNSALTSTEWSRSWSAIQTQPARWPRTAAAAR